MKTFLAKIHCATRAPNISQKYYEVILEQSKDVVFTHTKKDV